MIITLVDGRKIAVNNLFEEHTAVTMTAQAGMYCDINKIKSVKFVRSNW
jgi:hypothetical protein